MFDYYLKFCTQNVFKDLGFISTVLRNLVRFPSSTVSDTACGFMILTSIHYYCVYGLCKKIFFLRTGFPIPSNSHPSKKMIFESRWNEILMKISVG